MSADFREERGHAYMLTDQTYSLRQVFAKQPGTCLHCHAAVYLPYKRLGGGDLFRGFERMNAMPYFTAVTLVTHPVACTHCHELQSTQLRITRPAFINGIRKVKAAQGILDYDVNTMATHQEMRAYVCGQCHVEDYFVGPNKRLVYPWDKGLQGDRILAFYDEKGFKDWMHAETSAPTLKAQHPEFEMWNQGTHARSGVACADCHMPYVRVGAHKISDHHVRSPLLNVNNACQTCHHWPEGKLRQRVEEIQTRTFEMRNRAMDAVVHLIGDIRVVREREPGNRALAEAQLMQRKAQFLLDFVEAESSTGFHAPQEAARLLTLSLDYACLGQRALFRRQAMVSRSLLPMAVHG